MILFKTNANFFYLLLQKFRVTLNDIIVMIESICKLYWNLTAVTEMSSKHRDEARMLELGAQCGLDLPLVLSEVSTEDSTGSHR